MNGPRHLRERRRRARDAARAPELRLRSEQMEEVESEMMQKVGEMVEVQRKAQTKAYNSASCWEMQKDGSSHRV